MTEGQERAKRELERICFANPSVIELAEKPETIGDWLFVSVAIYLGPIESREDGLVFREREEFQIIISPTFPFDAPHIAVLHSRFAGFPHVTWGKYICLYQSSLEWNPSDGLYGFFERLRLWIEKAALNDMDPVEGPLEPPHHVTDLSQAPFVIRANAPCTAGESWVGLAVLREFPNRIELVGWDIPSAEWNNEDHPAFATVLARPLPMEFPKFGKDLFEALEVAGLPRNQIIRSLALAALFSKDGEPMHFILGLPMRRAPDGSSQLHIAVWTTSAERASTLRNILPFEADSAELASIKNELSEAVLAVLELSKISWCQVFDNRNEIVTRRDQSTAASWFAGKSVLILGCGALGSWTAEIAARARAKAIHLIDQGLVKPGILARQNFEACDIGNKKVDALTRRLKAIDPDCDVFPHNKEAHAFLTEKSDLLEFDLIVDCTASAIFQMKLERYWDRYARKTPPFISIVIDAQAKHCLCVGVGNASQSGVWHAYVDLKRQLCMANNQPKIVSAFYSARAAQRMLQPEPGCSDPTFVGSTADVMNLLSGALNVAIGGISLGMLQTAFALTGPSSGGSKSGLVSKTQTDFLEVVAGNYKVRIAENVFTQAKTWVQRNKRKHSAKHETGGLLWGMWDDALQIIWVFDLSGPPPDSSHNPAHFLCGVEGTHAEHNERFTRSHGVEGFVGHWHTHPDIPPDQSPTDMHSMASLVSSIGQNQKRSLMLIFGRTRGKSTAGIYVYESHALREQHDLISVGINKFISPVAVV